MKDEYFSQRMQPSQLEVTFQVELHAGEDIKNLERKVIALDKGIAAKNLKSRNDNNG